MAILRKGIKVFILRCDKCCPGCTPRQLVLAASDNSPCSKYRLPSSMMALITSPTRWP